MAVRPARSGQAGQPSTRTFGLGRVGGHRVEDVHQHQEEGDQQGLQSTYINKSNLIKPYHSARNDLWRHHKADP